MELKDRLRAPLPQFFKKIRSVGLLLAATGGVLLGAPVVLPAVVLHVAGYLVLAGGVMGIVSQATVEAEEKGSSLSSKPLLRNRPSAGIKREKKSRTDEQD